MRRLITFCDGIDQINVVNSENISYNKNKTDALRVDAERENDYEKCNIVPKGIRE